MAFPRRFFLILLALLLCAMAGWAADSKKAQQAYAAAVRDFHDGLWTLAEADFAQFIQNYSDSTNVPEAWLLQAQAVDKQGKILPAEGLLLAHVAAAGSLTDAYTYWIGEAQMQNGDFGLAANTLLAVPKSSSYALQAAVERAAALARLAKWSELITFLTSEQDVLASAAQANPEDELELRGRLLMAQARFALSDFEAAGKLLAAFAPGKLPPDLEWQRLYLLCQVKQLAGDQDTALALTTNLLQIARASPEGAGATNLSASVALHGSVLEDMGRATEAIDAFRENLSRNAPAARQQQAILKIAALSIAQGLFTNAETVLDNYVTQFTNSPAADVALLALGELYLRDYAAIYTNGLAPTPPDATNLLHAAQVRFDAMLAADPGSSFAGKAYLDRGWCGWLMGNYSGSLADFQNAVQRLPRSEDLAVAHFKIGDVLFAQGDFAGALAQYQEMLARVTEFPNLAKSLGDRALYQSLRAQLQLGDRAGAESNMARIAAAYPLSGLSQSGALLLGESYADIRQPAKELAVFQKFEQQDPNSPLRPTVDLAVARACEEAQNWPAALAQYDYWLKTYPTNHLLSQAMYSQAWANYQAGNETNALNLFTNFVARFPTDELAPAAQMWVADHYFRLGESVAAELKYKFIFQNTNWQNSATFTNAFYYPALMMAGRAAVSRTDNEEAIRDYFSKLEDDTNCPMDLRIQAAFADGGALMKMESTDTNNPVANYLKAIAVFKRVCFEFPTNENGARAWGEMADCYLQVSNYDLAADAYTHAINAPVANIALHSQAAVGLGMVLEKEAALLPAGTNQTALLTQALGCYLTVFYADNRNENEPEQDLFWTKEAGLRAADLVARTAQDVQGWRHATNIYYRLESQLPQLRDLLAKKIDAASQQINAAK